MGLYDYQKIYANFNEVLEVNISKAAHKKSEYLQKIITIFTQFVKKCQKEIDLILKKKIDQLSINYTHVKQYIQKQEILNQEQKNLIIAQFLIKPFEKFPFTGHKNEKLFKEQYNLIQKASVLIEQTLIDSFNEEQIPSFQNKKFFTMIHDSGLGSQSLTKLRLEPRNFKLTLQKEVQPIQFSVKSVKLLHSHYFFLVGQSKTIEIWDLKQQYCVKQLFLENRASICCIEVVQQEKQENEKQVKEIKKPQQNPKFLLVGFGDKNPQIWSYRMDNWQPYARNVSHTRKVTKLIEIKNYIISGSVDGNLCIHNIGQLQTIAQAQHVSPIEDIIVKQNYLYLLMKSSSICQYQLQNHQQNQVSLQFRRSISIGYISIIRSTYFTSNFTGVACHIYGLSQIEITRKFKIQQNNIINVVEMISDFVVLESKETSQFFAICAFQNSSTLRIYSLLSQQMVYELASDDYTQVGIADYLPKLQLFFYDSFYHLTVVSRSQLPNVRNTIKIYKFTL